MKNRIVFITGASSGIGRALALEFARLGAKVVLSARRLDRLQAVLKEVNELGGEGLLVQCDVTVEGDCERAVSEAFTEFGGIDIVVANAGFGVVGSVKDLSIDDYRRQFETNIFGVLRVVKAALPKIIQAQGQVVLMGSAMSYISLGESSPYSMSKFAVRALADSLRLELSPAGVGVTLVAPGFVESEIRKIDNHGEMVPGRKEELPAWLVMSSRQAAKVIVRGVEKNRNEIIVTFHAKLAIFLSRYFPKTLSWLIRFFD